MFAHYSAIRMEGYRTLKAGQTVRFEVEAGPKGMHAIAIEALEALEEAAAMLMK